MEEGGGMDDQGETHPPLRQRYREEEVHRGDETESSKYDGVLTLALIDFGLHHVGLLQTFADLCVSWIKTVGTRRR